MSINGEPYEARGLQDTIPLPVRGVVRIRMRFRDFTGDYVYHCHILDHEDTGMMGIVDVTRTGRRPSDALFEPFATCATRWEWLPTKTIPSRREAEVALGTAGVELDVLGFGYDDP